MWQSMLFEKQDSWRQKKVFNFSIVKILDMVSEDTKSLPTTIFLKEREKRMYPGKKDCISIEMKNGTKQKV